MVMHLYIDDRNIDRNISEHVFSREQDGKNKNIHYFDVNRYLFSNQLRDLTNQGLYGTVLIDSAVEDSFNSEFLALESKFRVSGGFDTNKEFKSSNVLKRYSGNINKITDRVLNYYCELIELLSKYNVEFNIFPVDIMTSVGNHRFGDMFDYFLKSRRANVNAMRYELYKYLYNFADLSTRTLFVNSKVSNYSFLRALKKDVKNHLDYVSNHHINNNVRLNSYFEDVYSFLNLYEKNWVVNKVNKDTIVGQFEENCFFSGVLREIQNDGTDINKVFVDDGILKNYEEYFDSDFVSKENSEDVPLIRVCDMLLGYFGQTQTHVADMLKYYYDRNFSGDIYTYDDDDLFVKFRNPGDADYGHWLDYHYKLTTLQDFFVRKIRDFMLRRDYINQYYPFWDDAMSLWTYYTFSAFGGYDVNQRNINKEELYAWGSSEFRKFPNPLIRKQYMSNLDEELGQNLYKYLFSGKMSPLWSDALLK